MLAKTKSGLTNTPEDQSDAAKRISVDGKPSLSPMRESFFLNQREMRHGGWQAPTEGAITRGRCEARWFILCVLRTDEADIEEVD